MRVPESKNHDLQIMMDAEPEPVRHTVLTTLNIDVPCSAPELKSAPASWFTGTVTCFSLRETNSTSMSLGTVSENSPILARRPGPSKPMGGVMCAPASQASTSAPYATRPSQDESAIDLHSSRRTGRHRVTPQSVGAAKEYLCRTGGPRVQKLTPA